jgi:hypothetical protein
LPAAAPAATALLIAAGCGSGKSTYTVAETKACLAEKGVAMRRKIDDFVASTALGGELRADLGSNEVTISFGLDEAEAQRIAQAYRLFRGANIGIESVLRPSRNAVLLWKETPSPGDEAIVTGCLR